MMRDRYIMNTGMMLRLLVVFLSVVFFAQTTNAQSSRRDINVKDINRLLDDWHGAAAVGDSSYFDYFDEDSYYLGTDCKEVWTLQQFKDYAMPSFRRGSAWSFKKKKRHVFLGKYGHYAWVDETLDTWMGLCRGTGVLEKLDDRWVIKHYSLSVLVSNEIIYDYVKMLDKDN